MSDTSTGGKGRLAADLLSDSAVSEIKAHLTDCPVCEEPFEAVARWGRLGRIENVGICLIGDLVFFHGERAKLPASELGDEGPRAVLECVESACPPSYFHVDPDWKSRYHDTDSGQEGTTLE